LTALVSVLTPSLNQARWLRDSLRSVADQTYPHVEHVVMDGGSTDGTIGLLEAAGTHVRWRSEPDRGQSHALNKALAVSRGEIIGWLNADDAYFDAQVVEQVAAAFRRHPDIDVVYGHAALANADGLILQMLWVPPFTYELLKRHNYIIQPAAFVRRSALEGRLADESYHFVMDRELWLRLGRRRRFLRIDRVLAIDRHHPYRKSLSTAFHASDEHGRLNRCYAVPDGRVDHAVLTVSKLVFRLAGAGLVPAAYGPHAFTARLDGLLPLATRQLARRRAAMPLGSP
jgi:glycosyltransferase involved in cell wall biosynthesis